MSSKSNTNEFLLLEHVGHDFSKVFPLGKGSYGKKAAWKDVLSEILSLPIAERGGAYVKCYKDVEEIDYSETRPYDIYSSGEVLFCMDRYGLELPRHGFVNYDYASFMSYVEYNLLKEGLKEPSVYFQATEGLPPRHPFEGELYWMRYDENRRIVDTAYSFAGILPKREELTAHSVDLSVGTRNAEHRVFTTGAELAYLLHFMEGQPTLTENWIDEMYQSDAVDAFLALHYGDYQAFLLSEGYVGRNDSRLNDALTEISKTLPFSVVEPDLAGFNAQLGESTIWGIGEVCLLMRQYGIPGEDNLVRRFCLAGRSLPIEIASDHVAEQLALSHLEYPTNASLSSYHDAVVMNPDLLSLAGSEKLESLRKEKDFWSPLKDFVSNSDVRQKVPIPEGLWDDKLFQAEGLLSRIISEEELGERLYPENRKIHTCRENIHSLSMEECASMLGEQYVMIDPSLIKYVPKEGITPHMAKRILREDWSKIPYIPTEVMRHVQFSEEDVKNAWRRQELGFRNGIEAFTVFHLLPEGFRTASIKRWMNDVEQVYLGKDKSATDEWKMETTKGLKR